MRYAPPGLCLNDFAVLGSGPYLLLHLQGPWTPEFDATRLETSYGRALSHDLVSWEPLGPAFGVGLPGRFDDSAVWTMHPFPFGAGMAMAYTGVELRPHVRQAVGMAFSERTDGTGWSRGSGGPVTRPDPRWYRTGPGEAWRDPWVVADAVPGARWAMLTAARTETGPLDRSGCVGLATSDDLERWEIHPSPLIPGDVDELECPILEPYDEGWLLLASIAPARRIEAWWGERVTGPWHRLGPIAPPGPYAPRLVDGPDGERLVLHTVPRRVGLRDDGAPCRGMLAQPKVLRRTPYGPRLAWWSGLGRHLGPEHDGGAADAVLDAVFDVDLAGSGADHHDGAPVRLSLGDGLRVTLSVGTAGGTAGGAGGGAGGGATLAVDGPAGGLQAVAVPEPPRHLRVLTVGEFVEVYADDILVVSTASYAPRSGEVTCRIGSRPGEVRVRPLCLPDPGRDDVSALWPGASAPRPGVSAPRPGVSAPDSGVSAAGDEPDPGVGHR
jgi:hypothetical protein